ncbi:MAG: queuosine precursor transporter [Bacteroidales bacterium]|nr:queuosine precursor transporter [Bacteroidales bacterium]
MLKNSIHPSEDRRQNLFFILSGIFIGNVLLAELVGTKIFSFSALLEPLADAGKPFPLQINMSVGVLIWPFAFILSDITNEYFGKAGVRKMSFLAAAIVIFASLVIMLATSLPPASFWKELNGTDPAGNPLDINYAYSLIFRQGISIVIGSVTAFLVSQFVDVYVFIYLHALTGSKALWLRATGSTIVSQLIDSYIILFIAFYLMGNWNLKQVFETGTMQYLYKISFAILLTPLLYLAHYLIERYLHAQPTRQHDNPTIKNHNYTPN